MSAVAPEIARSMFPETVEAALDRGRHPDPSSAFRARSQACFAMPYHGDARRQGFFPDWPEALL